MHERLIGIAAALLVVGAAPQDAGEAPAGSEAPAAAVPAAAAAAVTPMLTAAELEELLAPIALYPDPLIAQILPASTYPMEIVKAARFVAKEKDESKIDAQDWDPSVQAVAHYPTVIQMMNEDLDWTEKLGAAFLDQQADVMNAIQRLRAQARAVGTLESTPQQTVVVEQSVIQIVPASPTVVYVPVYNPRVVYVAQPVYRPAPVITFAAGVAVGYWWGRTVCNWHHHCVGWGGSHTSVNIKNNVNIDNSRNSNINVGNRPSTLPANAGADGGRAWTRDNRRGGAPSLSQPSGAQGARPSTRPAPGGGIGGGSGAGPARTPTASTGAITRPAAGSVGTQRPAASTQARVPSNRSAFDAPKTGVPSRAALDRGSQSTGSRPSAAQRPASSPSRPSSGADRGSAFERPAQGAAATRGASARGSASRGSGGRR